MTEAKHVQMKTARLSELEGRRELAKVSLVVMELNPTQSRADAMGCRLRCSLFDTITISIQRNFTRHRVPKEIDTLLPESNMIKG